MMSMALRTALIVDDDPDIRALLRTVLQLSTDFACDEAADGDRAFDSWRMHHQDVIVLDHAMPGLTGLEVARAILDLEPGQLVIMFSAYLDGTIIREAEQLGVRRVLSKSEFSQLVDALQAADQDY